MVGATEDKFKKSSHSKARKIQPDLGKRKQAVELRLRGYSYQAIGDEIGGISASRVYALVKHGLEVARAEFTETAGEALQFELDRIERMITLFEKVIFPSDAVAQDQFDENTGEIVVPKLSKQQLDASWVVDKLLDRKARLLGFFKADETKNRDPLPWNDEDG